MTRLLTFLILAGLAAELASIIMVGNVLGVVPTLLLLFAGGAVGISLVRSAGLSIAAALRSPVQTSSFQRSAASGAAVRVISGLLFLIPGFFSDLLGLLLLLPPVRQWLRSKTRAESHSTSGQAGRGYETVIDAEAIEMRENVLRPGPAPGQQEDERTDR